MKSNNHIFFFMPPVRWSERLYQMALRDIVIECSLVFLVTQLHLDSSAFLVPRRNLAIITPHFLGLRLFIEVFAISILIVVPYTIAFRPL